MLRSLEVRDILLIDWLELEFRPGLNVLTGETGAGKSILLDCLGFALGWEGRHELLRSGAASGEVIACFDIDAAHPVRSLLDEAGLPAQDELVIRRSVRSDGRTAAHANDRRCSRDVLRRLAELLVELHGRRNEAGILDQRRHRSLLDRFGGIDASEVRNAWKSWRNAEKRLKDARDSAAASRADIDYLEHTVSELEDHDPAEGEEAVLDSKRRLMREAERIREDISRAAECLGAQSAEGMVTDAARWVRGVAGAASGRLDAAGDALDRALGEIAEAQRELADCFDALAFNSTDLDAAEERLFALRRLARKHNVTPDELPEVLVLHRARLAASGDAAESATQLKAAAAVAGEAYRNLSASLSERRREAGARLDAKMASELAPLRLDRALFRTEVLEGDPGAKGTDSVTFKVSTSPDVPPGALNRMASGGELSRFLLALKACLAGGGEARTMIFDEIDRGVGGATADAVGRRLAALASGSQVLVVTHAPQVAALGDHHWRVAKRFDGTRARVEVCELPMDARVDEVARMLSGNKVTEEARAAAVSLLSE